MAEIVNEISSSEYAIDDRLSRFRWMPEMKKCGIVHPRVLITAEDKLLQARNRLTQQKA